MPVYWYGANNNLTTAGANFNNGLDVAKLAITWLGCDPTSLSDISTIGNNSTKEETLVNQVYDQARKSVLQDYPWQFAKRHMQLNPDDGYIESYANNITISNISQADPAVITCSNNHGFKNGWTIYVDSVVGMTQINNRYLRCNNANGANFTADGLNTTNFNAYASGGNAVRREPYSDYRNGYTYRVPSDYVRHVHAEDRPKYELVGAGNDRRILCELQYPIIEYVADINNVSEMTDEFKRAWAARIAAELAAPLQKKGSAAKDMWAYYRQVLERESQPMDASAIDPKGTIEERSSVLDYGGFDDA